MIKFFMPAGGLKIILFSAIIFLLSVFGALAAENIDSDKDGLFDDEEINIYKTDPQNADTDSDGFSDGDEIKNGYSPLNKDKIKLEKIDSDNDGLNDKLEIAFKTDLLNMDTDSDGYLDGAEVKSGHDPASTTKKKLVKKIEINLKKQELYYFLGKVQLGQFIVSSGVKNTTPKGKFVIGNKHPKAWSSYGLWMPYWLGLKGQRFGLHELPYWPDGRREGEGSLGRPASHGCVRMGRNGEAKTLYEWAEVGTAVVIY